MDRVFIREMFEVYLETEDYIFYSAFGHPCVEFNDGTYYVLDSEEHMTEFMKRG